MTTATIDTLKPRDKRASVGFGRTQTDAIGRAIAEAQDELIIRKDLELALAPI